MSTSVADKLRIKPGFVLLTRNAPPGFKKALAGLPAGVKIISSGEDYDQIHWFVKDRVQMEKELEAVIRLIHNSVVCWIYYPKGGSGLQTDLTRDKGWDRLLKHDKFQWISLISFDDTWSTFGIRLKTAADAKKESKPATRAVFDYVDPATKTVTLPPELKTLLTKNKKAADFFDALSFTNKKEYIEWIVTAKRPETKQERLTGTVERLVKGWKNPGNQ